VAPVALLAADGARARAYVQVLCAAGQPPAELLLMPGDWTPPAGLTADEVRRAGFDPNAPLSATAEQHGVPVRRVDSREVNSPETIAAVAACGHPVVIFCAPAGQILKREILATGKRFLHAHPGRVPEFRGSTTVYYSLLEEDRCAVSAIFLNAEIDRGDVVLIEHHEPPRGLNVDVLYDPAIRARTLAAAVNKLQQTGPVGEPQAGAEPAYYVVHPVLKHIALLGAKCWA
jgi:methionyl-tRNA formyltransferase